MKKRAKPAGNSSRNASGGWAGAPNSLYFTFLHRFNNSGAPVRQVTNRPTFLLAVPLAGGVVLGLTGHRDRARDVNVAFSSATFVASTTTPWGAPLAGAAGAAPNATQRIRRNSTSAAMNPKPSVGESATASPLTAADTRGQGWFRERVKRATPVSSRGCTPASISATLGATPGSIVRMVVKESVMLTTLAGYLGLVAAVATLAAAPS